MSYVVISGAGKGIGRVIALHLAQTGGYELVLVSRTATSLEETTLACRALGCETHAIAADLSDPAALSSIVWPFSKPIPIALINNAGGYLGKNITETTADELYHQINQNLLTAFNLTNSLIARIREHGNGKILSVGSIASVNGLERGGAYAASKHALRGWSASLRKELRHEGIGVSLVNIGPTWSSSWEGSGMDPARIIDPNDVAILMESMLRLSPRSVVDEVLLMPMKGDV
jgi:short-subunit dehydrogenase